MGKNSQDVKDALLERLQKYESILFEIFQDSRSIGKIIAGPEVIGNNNFYRVEVNGTQKYLVYAGNADGEIDQDTEVIVNETSIVSVLPKKLSVSKKPNDFKRVSWNEVGGLKSQIEEIKRQVDGHIKKAVLYKEFGIEESKGALLYGPPGCGKTLISKVIASTILGQKGAEDSFIYIKGPELLNKYVGSTEESIRDIFAQCRKASLKTGNRSVIFIDEAEALLSKRGAGNNNNLSSTIVPQFLSEMDGFDENGPFVLLSTNFPESLDPAVIREGRIDLKIEIQRPTESDLHEIFDIHLKPVRLKASAKDLSALGVRLLVESGKPLSGSLVKAITNMAAQEALYRFDTSNKDKGIIEIDLESAIKKVTSHNLNL